MKIPLLLDNIIFSLQRSGGISVVWQEHISRLVKNKFFSCRFIEYDDAPRNIFRNNIDIPAEYIETFSSRFLQVKRYFNIKDSGYKTPYIFHSSYYRIDKNRFAKNITTLHDFNYEYFIKGIRKKIHSYQKGFAINNSDAIICISDSTRRDLFHFYPHINKDIVHVVHNGVNPGFHRIGKGNHRLSLPFEEGGFILYVGGHHAPYKNFNLAIEVCQSLRIPFVIAGGEQLLEQEKAVLDSKLGKSNYIHLWNLPTADLNELYNRALVLVYPSLYEGFGIPILEAQRAGCPVIAFAVSSIPEVMGKTDFLLEDKTVDAVVEAIKELVNRPSLKDDEIKRGLSNSDLFSWDRTFEETIEVYKSLL